MRQILWFRRDLRIEDSGILANGKDAVLPIFIFDPHILDKLTFNDKRVTFIYRAVLDLKKALQSIGLDLTIFYGKPVEVFKSLLKERFDEVVTSIDFDAYAQERDAKIERLLPIKRVYDSFLIPPEDAVKKDGLPYKVFTPYYKSFLLGFQDSLIIEKIPTHLKLIPYAKKQITLEEIGFTNVQLPKNLLLSAKEHLTLFKSKVSDYEKDRDYFYKDASSHMGIYLRFGLISIRELFNTVIAWRDEGLHVESYIRQLFWRDFYHAILYHFPESETKNFDIHSIVWENDEQKFENWCEGKTGVPIIDAAMIHLKRTGTMHNRLRMIVASFLCKNLLIDWKWGADYFAKYLLDYEASSNIGSWQWAAGTGADAAPYFRVFNPYLQSKRFDPEARFIKFVMPQFSDIDPKLFHVENGLQKDLFSDYPKAIVDIKASRQRAIDVFKRARDAT